jgi:hypothetical protein
MLTGKEPKHNNIANLIQGYINLNQIGKKFKYTTFLKLYSHHMGLA